MIDPGRSTRDGGASVADPLGGDGLAPKALESEAIAETGRAATVGAVV